MAKAFKCDRCQLLFEGKKPLSQTGEVYEPTTDHRPAFTIKYQLLFKGRGFESYGQGFEPDLCHSCRRDTLESVKAAINSLTAATGI